jgi:acetoin utilization deacetylase AcuC-like enzyme
MKSGLLAAIVFSAAMLGISCAAGTGAAPVQQPPATPSTASAATPTAASAATTVGSGATINVGLVYDDACLRHASPGHPEKPERLTAIREVLENAGLGDRMVHIPARPATDEVLGLVHTPAYIKMIRETAATEKEIRLAGDTYAVAGSWQAAQLAAGGVCAAVDAVVKGEVASAFCAVRPPGHHASAEKAAGFCIFNNVAIAARYIQTTHKLNRVLIVDWDAHHGNGTQDTFYRSHDIMYISIHQSPLYPGTGSVDEKGEGSAEGHILNFPLAPGAGDEEFLKALKDGLAAAEKFKPDFVLISAGFDAHKDDPIAGLQRTEKGFAEGTRLVKALAAKTARGRIVSVLEGGYNLNALGSCVLTHIQTLVEP